MRVGLVAKGLLLKGDKDVELVLLCANKPTVTLLKQVAEKLTAQLEVEQVPPAILSFSTYFFPRGFKSLFLTLSSSFK